MYISSLAKRPTQKGIKIGNFIRLHEKKHKYYNYAKKGKRKVIEASFVVLNQCVYLIHFNEVYDG